MLYSRTLLFYFIYSNRNLFLIVHRLSNSYISLHYWIWTSWNINSLAQNNNSVQFSHSAVSNSLQPHESQHTRLPCPSPTPGVYSNSCPSNWLLTKSHSFSAHLVSLRRISYGKLILPIWLIISIIISIG